MELKKYLIGVSCLFFIVSIALWVATWIGVRYSKVGGFLEANPVTITGPVVGGIIFVIFSAFLGLLVGWIIYKCCE